jgi:YHS domain-containing protein
MTKDPVCGMAIEESKAASTATHQGTTYYFCGESCKAKFLQDPDRYAGSGHGGHH